MKLWSKKFILNTIKLFIVRFFAAFGLFVLSGTFIFKELQTKEEIILNIGSAIMITLISLIFDVIERKESLIEEKDNNLQL